MQLADSALPTGGFVHSGGLEAAVQIGIVCDRGDLEAFCRDSLMQFGSWMAPFLAAAWDDGGRVGELDLLCESHLSDAVANRASRAQGQAWLLAGSSLAATVVDLRARLRAAASPGHLAPVCGAVLALLGVGRQQALELATFQHLRGIVSAAVRLNLVGPLEAQALQASCADACADAAGTGGRTPVEDAAQTAPLLDLWQGHQDRLYSRLFNT